MIASLDHAHQMINVLPKWVNADIAPELQFAALEDWLTNIRLVSEFYRVAGQGSPRDFSVNDFLTDFDIEQNHKEELKELWLLASKHVSHLSRQRIPQTNQTFKEFDYSLKNLQRISDFVGNIYADFKSKIANNQNFPLSD